MKNKYKKIWDQVEPLMEKVKKKDYVLHVKMVVRAMGEIIAKEGGNPDILIPAAILHDVGWSEVSEDLQLAEDKEKKYKAGLQHIKKSPPIVRKILRNLGYDNVAIKHIIDIILAHKFSDPKEKDKQLLIDADTLSDTYKESFYSDVKSYNSTPKKTLDFRSKNTFYTKAARGIFQKQLAARQREIDQT